MRQTTHVVWDWNGTLLDDLHIVVRAVNETISPFGFGPIDADDYRNHYTRPVRDFYVSLFGRQIADDEWLLLNTGFHDAYFRLATTADLASGARDALKLLSDSGVGQSLLSMSPQDWLTKIVRRLGIESLFVRVDGLTNVDGGLKAPQMKRHLDRIEVDEAKVVVVGDTPDDVAAARHVGGEPILFHGGSHHLELLEREGVPIAETISEVVEMVLSRG